MQLAPDINAEDIQVFLQEANEQLQLLDEDVVRLEREAHNTELVQEIFRAAHTLKGSSGMLGYKKMAEVAHAMESILDKLRKGDLAVTSALADGLLRGLDTLKLLKDDLANNRDNEIDVRARVTELELISQKEDVPFTPRVPFAPATLAAKTVEPREAASSLNVRVVFRKDAQWIAVRCFQILKEMEEVGRIIRSSPTREDVEKERVGSDLTATLETGLEVARLKERLQAVEDVEQVVIDASAVVPSAAAPTEGSPSSGSRPSGRGSGETVRVDVGRLDDLMNLVGELSIERTRILQISRALESRHKDDPLVQALSRTSGHIVKVVHELQEGTMRVRMQPIGTLFNGFPRMVRDLARKLDKKVEFVMDGQETEVDRTVVERLRDPLIHLLRNAIDHGIEDAQERARSGKPEVGIVRLSAHHEQGRILITVQDDGRGIDGGSVRDSALRKGLIGADVASRLTESQCIDLIFLPGSSTAVKTSDVSGRGVGMDIVKTNVQSANGIVDVVTRKGEGTRFVISLPLTLATLNGLLVASGDTVFVIPMASLVEVLLLERHRIETVLGNEVITVRGKVLPLVRLRRDFDVGGGSNQPETVAAIVRSGEKSVALAVDSVMEPQETVVKSLGQYFGNVRGIAGSTILGDGSVGLIIDAATMVQEATGRGAQYSMACAGR